MKTTGTLKQQFEYNAKYSSFLSSEKFKLERLIRFNEHDSNTFDQIEEIKAEQVLVEAWFNSLKTVNVSFMVGYRIYYRPVVKIGKAYYTHKEKMTKKNGYRCIEEIGEITDQMKNDMIADSYYY